jgi:hypothetical protein
MKNSQPSKIYAPQLDDLIRRAKGSADAPDEVTKAQVMIFLDKLKAITVCGDDERRELWFYAERGTIDDFGDYEEYRDNGEVETREEFQNLWEGYYPDPLQWYRLTSVSYKGTHSLFLGDNFVFQIEPEPNPKRSYSVDNSELATWMTSALDNTIQSLQDGAYNSFVEKHLPYRIRLGKILRDDYWSIIPQEKSDYLKEISQEEIHAFVKQVETQPQD